MSLMRRGARFLASLGVASLLLACEGPHASGSTPVASASGPVELVLIHTADLHSHVFPQPTLITSADARRGLGTEGEVEAVGGLARLASLVRRERNAAAHSLYLDSGDLVVGTAAFTAFHGEPEMRALSELGVAAAALGNHDLDLGAAAFAEARNRFETFPVLAANYRASHGALLGEFAPYAIVSANGLKVGVIGVANPASPSGLGDSKNELGITLLDTASAVQAAIDTLCTKVDVIVAITHLGLGLDESLIAHTSGLDVVLGGHEHLTLDAALTRSDCGVDVRAKLGCAPRHVVLVHSGALSRYVGRVALTLSPAASPSNGWEVTNAVHTLLPVAAAVPEDPSVHALLEPYRARLTAEGLDRPLAFALGSVERYAANGGDSALGDLVTDALRQATGAPLAILNTTGIRADLPPGPLTQSELIAALPFDDPLTVLEIRGADLLATLEQQQARAAAQCQSAMQLSGLSVEFACTGASPCSGLGCSPNGRVRALIAGAPIDPGESYLMVTTVFIAEGNTGFDALRNASARRDLELEPVDALLRAVTTRSNCPQSELPCLDPSTFRDGRIRLRAR